MTRATATDGWSSFANAKTLLLRGVCSVPILAKDAGVAAATAATAAAAAGAAAAVVVAAAAVLAAVAEAVLKATATATAVAAVPATAACRGELQVEQLCLWQLHEPEEPSGYVTILTRRAKPLSEIHRKPNTPLPHHPLTI